MELGKAFGADELLLLLFLPLEDKYNMTNATEGSSAAKLPDITSPKTDATPISPLSDALNEKINLVPHAPSDTKSPKNPGRGLSGTADDTELPKSTGNLDIVSARVGGEGGKKLWISRESSEVNN